MGANGSTPVSARFDRFHVDLSSGELLRSGERVPIQEKPLQVLRLLLEAEGNVVTREQLRSALWPADTFVDFEHGVNTAVKKLRAGSRRFRRQSKVRGDSAKVRLSLH